MMRGEGVPQDGQASSPWASDSLTHSSKMRPHDGHSNSYIGICTGELPVVSSRQASCENLLSTRTGRLGGVAGVYSGGSRPIFFAIDDMRRLSQGPESAA